MKQEKRKRTLVNFERAEIQIGNVKIITGGLGHNTEIWIDGKLQTNIEVLKFVIDARKQRMAKLYLEIIPDDPRRRRTA
jgi:hypothetical protein